MKAFMKDVRRFLLIDGGTAMRRGIRGYRAAGLVTLVMLALYVPGARADVLTGPATSNVQVSGTTVTATIVPENVGGAIVEAAEFYVDSDPVLSDGYRIPMTLSGTSGTVTATGTLPTLAIGTYHTVYVHGQGLVPVGNHTWGAFDYTGFTVAATTVGLPLGNAEIALSNSRYSINLLPQDPCMPTDPCRVRSRFGRWNAAETLGYDRTNVAVPDGVLSLYTRVTIPTDSCAPVDPCRRRSFLIGFEATNGLKYDAATMGLLTIYTPR